MHSAVREYEDRLSELLNPAEAGGKGSSWPPTGAPSRGWALYVAPFAPAEPAEAPRRLRSQGWLRPGNGQPIHAVPEPVPPGPAGEVMRSLVMLADGLDAS
ncbi:MAG: hypothetical protein VKO19_02645 [Cyanobacteriota bacterium]|nr:hypothetical protein [Cyanobacteriota bacterium]